MLNSMEKLCLRVHQQGSSDKASAEVSPQSFIWLFNKAAFLCHTYHKAVWRGCWDGGSQLTTGPTPTIPSGNCTVLGEVTLQDK